MIYLKITSHKQEDIEKVCLLLLQKNLIIDAEIERGNKRILLQNDELEEVQIFTLSAKTRALLFTSIDELIRANFKKQLPEIYSLPIINMDWEQADQLKKNLT